MVGEREFVGTGQGQINHHQIRLARPPSTALWALDDWLLFSFSLGNHAASVKMTYEVPTEYMLYDTIIMVWRWKEKGFGEEEQVKQGS